MSRVVSGSDFDLTIADQSDVSKPNEQTRREFSFLRQSSGTSSPLFISPISTPFDSPRHSPRHSPLSTPFGSPRGFESTIPAKNSRSGSLSKRNSSDSRYCFRQRVSAALERHFCTDKEYLKILDWCVIDTDQNRSERLYCAECACCAATHFVQVLFHDLNQQTFIVHRYGVDVKDHRMAFITSDQFKPSKHPYRDAKKLDHYFYNRFCENLNAKKAPIKSSRPLPIPPDAKKTLQRRGTLSRLIRRKSSSSSGALSNRDQKERPEEASFSPDTFGSPSPLQVVARPPIANCTHVYIPKAAPVFFGVSCRHYATLSSLESENKKAKWSNRNSFASTNSSTVVSPAVSATTTPRDTPVVSPRTSEVIEESLDDFFDRLASTPPHGTSPIANLKRSSESLIWTKRTDVNLHGRNDVTDHVIETDSAVNEKIEESEFQAKMASIREKVKEQYAIMSDLSRK